MGHFQHIDAASLSTEGQQPAPPTQAYVNICIRFVWAREGLFEGDPAQLSAC